MFIVEVVVKLDQIGMTQKGLQFYLVQQLTLHLLLTLNVQPQKVSLFDHLQSSNQPGLPVPESRKNLPCQEHLSEFPLADHPH